MASKQVKDDWVTLKGTVAPADIQSLASKGAIGKLSLSNMPALTAAIAKSFSSLHSIKELRLWCDVTRSAIRHIIAVNGLRTLDVLCCIAPGRLERFFDCRLETFRGSHFLTAGDLLEILRCRSLRELGAQGAKLSEGVITAMLESPSLESVDLEGTRFNDRMAERLGTSVQLTTLHLGATRIRRNGLKHLCRMQQLRSLDLWATAIEESDLDLLTELPNLEYLSLGNFAHLPSFNPATLLPKLYAIKSLKRIWLDGIKLEPAHKAALHARYESVQVI